MSASRRYRRSLSRRTAAGMPSTSRAGTTIVLGPFDMNPGRRLLAGLAVAGLVGLVVAVGLLWRLHASEPLISEGQARAIASQPATCGGHSLHLVVTWSAYEQGQAHDHQGHLLYPSGSPFWIAPFLANQFWVVETHAPPQDIVSAGDGTLHFTRADFQIVLDAHSGEVLYCGGNADAFASPPTPSNS
jgi:hypothetical protein